MVDQPSPNSTRIPISVPISLPKTFMNGESSAAHVYVFSNSTNETRKEKSTNDPCFEDNTSGAVDLGVSGDVLVEDSLEVHPPSVTMVVEANDLYAVTEKQIPEISSNETSEVELMYEERQESKGHDNSTKHTDHIQNNLPVTDNFESSMDRKSSTESGFEDQGNLSNTDSLEKKRNLAKDESSMSDFNEYEANDAARDIMSLSCSSAVSSTASQLSSPSDLLSDMSVSTLLQQEMEPLIDEDSSTSCSFPNSLSESSSGDQTPDLIFERSWSDSGMSPDHFEEASRSLPSSKSIEKIVSAHKHSKEHNVVRASKSHENYLHNQDFQFVAIDIDDATYSLDQIPQNPTPTFKEDHDNAFPLISPQKLNHQELCGTIDQVNSQPLVSNVEDDGNELEDKKNECSDSSEKGFKCTEEESNKTEDVVDSTDQTLKQQTETILAKPCDTNNEESNVNNETHKKCYSDESCDTTDKLRDNCAISETCDTTDEVLRDNCAISEASVVSESEHAVAVADDTETQLTTNSEASSDISDEAEETADEAKEFGQDGFFYQPPVKHIDQPSAQRLAKRLYNLDGFQKSDVSRHLSKKNDFSTTVAEEYLKLFSFAGDTLDVALRKFLKQFSLIGETQERERVLAHFSHHYILNNPSTFDSEDACHTLVCAIMLLNTDLHGQAVGRKMTCPEFIENLSDLNDGVNFHKDVLKAIYQAIKAEPIEWAPDEEFVEGDQRPTDQHLPQHPVANNSQLFVGRNPFLDIPDPSQTTEYKKGYIMRKCCLEPDGRKTPLGRRGWKMFFVVLRDMILYLHKDEHEMKKKGFVEGSHNVILIHHGLAVKATDYSKKQHVFRLQTADWAQYLFQTSNSKELQEWIDTVNFVAASLSAPPLPGAVGSQKKFQRPLLPVSYTRFNLQDQLSHLEERLSQTETELKDHQTYPPEKGSKSSLIQHYLEKESYLEFEIKRLQTYTHLIQSRLVSHPELKPTLVETSIGEDDEFPHAVKPLDGGQKKSPVQRSISDRGPSSTLVGGTCGSAQPEYINEQSEETYL